jgi:SAM-dependent methyltransferase
MMTPVPSVISYGAGVPDERELRLCGDLNGKRVLVLGDAGNAVAFAERGARVLATAPTDEVADGREQAIQSEVHVEFHPGDLADLGFATSGSIDLVFSSELSGVDDLSRVLRQAHRVLKPEGSLVFAVPHPLAAMLEGGEVVLRRAYGSGARTASDYFMAVMRAGFRVDVMAEPAPLDQPGALVPAALVMRAKKLGV